MFICYSFFAVFLAIAFYFGDSSVKVIAFCSFLYNYLSFAEYTAFLINNFTKLCELKSISFTTS
jgi:hypothetical protein